MSIIIRVEDRQEFGQGHRSRAIAILQAIKREGREGYIITNNVSWIDFLKIHNLPVIALESSEHSTTEIDEILKISKELNSSRIVLDGGRFDEEYCKKMASGELAVILVNDLPKNIISSASCVVNPNIYATKDLYLKPWPETFFGGPEYILLRESFLKPKTEKSADGRILISLGVSADIELIEMLKKMFSKKGLKFDFAINLSERQMVEAIDNADIVICGASVTLHEVWSRSRYAIPIYQAKDQELFRNYLLSQNVEVVDGIDKSPPIITAAIEKIIENINGELKAVNINPFGANRLINQIYENCH